MKTLILSGSRNPTGQTAQAAGAFLQGVLAAGAQGEIVFLPPLHVERCRQCNEQGWGECLTDG
ncbi:MAG: flavodoxin family protein, partial [Phycisphaerae bacterium]